MLRQLKENWILIATILLSYVIAIFAYGFSIEQRTFDTKEQKRKVIEHSINNTDVHMPMAEKIKVFVPRTEIEKTQDLILKQLERIEDKLDK